MKTARVLPQHGLSPIGGTVDGVDQMAAHRDGKNELAGGAKVVLSTPTVTGEVTTWGGFYKNERIPVVKVQGKDGWYLASAFGTA